MRIIKVQSANNQWLLHLESLEDLAAVLSCIEYGITIVDGAPDTSEEEARLSELIRRTYRILAEAAE